MSLQDRLRKASEWVEHDQLREDLFEAAEEIDRSNAMVRTYERMIEEMPPTPETKDWQEWSVNYDPLIS